MLDRILDRIARRRRRAQGAAPWPAGPLAERLRAARRRRPPRPWGAGDFRLPAGELAPAVVRPAPANRHPR